MLICWQEVMCASLVKLICVALFHVQLRMSTGYYGATFHVASAKMEHFAITPLVTAIMDVRKIG